MIGEKRAAGRAPRQRGINLRRLGLSPRQLGKSPRQSLPPELPLGFTPKVRPPKKNLIKYAGRDGLTHVPYYEKWARNLLREAVRPPAPVPPYVPGSMWIAGPAHTSRERQELDRAAEEKENIAKAIEELQAGAERARALGFL